MHLSRETRSYLQDHPEIPLHPWFPKGADINPIENVWGEIVKALGHSEAHLSKNKDELFQEVELVWNYYRDQRGEFIQNLVRGMPGRMQKLVGNQGGWIGH